MPVCAHVQPTELILTRGAGATHFSYAPFDILMFC